MGIDIILLLTGITYKKKISRQLSILELPNLVAWAGGAHTKYVSFAQSKDSKANNFFNHDQKYDQWILTSSSGS